MTRETRLNLIVLVVLVAVSIPGGVILFKKKLNPNAPKMFEPDKMPESLPYMARIPTPPQMPRTVPPRAIGWVCSLAMAHGGIDGLQMVRSPDGTVSPLISDRRLFQVTAIQSGPDSWRASILIWDDRLGPKAGDYAMTAEQGSRKQSGIIRQSYQTAVPRRVREELQYAGYPRPPVRVVGVNVEFPGQWDKTAPLILRLNYKSDKLSQSDFVRIFTNTLEIRKYENNP